MCRKYFCQTVGEAGVEIGLGQVDHPDEVGADRLVNAVAARKAKGAMIVSLGTAPLSTSTTTAITVVRDRARRQSFSPPCTWR